MKKALKEKGLSLDEKTRIFYLSGDTEPFRPVLTNMSGKELKSGKWSFPLKDKNAILTLLLESQEEPTEPDQAPDITVKAKIREELAKEPDLNDVDPEPIYNVISSYFGDLSPPYEEILELLEEVVENMGGTIVQDKEILLTEPELESAQEERIRADAEEIKSILERIIEESDVFTMTLRQVKQRLKTELEGKQMMPTKKWVKEEIKRIVGTKMEVEVEEILFYDPKEEYGEFSNFWDNKHHKKKFKTDFKLRIDGEDWHSTEEYFQAQKFAGQGDLGEEYIQIIRSADTSGKKAALARQKLVGRFVQKWMIDTKKDRRKVVDVITRFQEAGLTIRDDWEEAKDDIMRKAVLAKFQQNPELKSLLVSTTNKRLVENSPRDYYWGIGKEGTGLNRLGSILVETREGLVEEVKEEVEEVEEEEEEEEEVEVEEVEEDKPPTLEGLALPMEEKIVQKKPRKSRKKTKKLLEIDAKSSRLFRDIHQGTLRDILSYRIDGNVEFIKPAFIEDISIATPETLLAQNKDQERILDIPEPQRHLELVPTIQDEEDKKSFALRKYITLQIQKSPSLDLSSDTIILLGYILANKVQYGVRYDPQVEAAVDYVLTRV